MSKLIAVDADLMVYRIGFACQQTVQFAEGWAYPFADQGMADCMFQKEVDKYTERFKGAKIVFCLSDPYKNFRKDILPTYKGNRNTGGQRPILFAYIRGMIMAQGEAYWEPTLEADDLLGILATRDNAIMVTIDKDMMTIPGLLCNPTTWKTSRSTVAQADHFHLFQTLTGDQVDNYKGCPGVGPLGAAKVLEDGATWEAVVAAYEKKGLDEEDALVQAQVARILRTENYVNGAVKLWTP